jgi:hypothetical protein
MMSLTLWWRHALRVVACLAVLGCVLAPTAGAQSQGTGQIVGTVYDSSGATVPNAKVIATGKATGLLREAETNAEGGYRIVLLPPGLYSVEVKQSGFKAFKSEVTVNVGSAVTVDARLQVGQISEVVEVVATTVIETTAVQTDALINQRSIVELPINGRRFHDFVALTPTVTIEPSRNQISFAGSRGVNSNITIDGADYNQPFFGGIRGGERASNAFTIPQEAISEFQIVPYGYSAEFGRSTAGVMNAVTKSGTNDWHGSAFYFDREKEFARVDPFGRDSLDVQRQYGGSVGGAIRKDKSFVFASGEQQKQNLPRKVVFRQLLDPTSAACTAPVPPVTSGCRYPWNSEAWDFYNAQQTSFNQTNDAWTIFGRWDEQLTSNHRVGVRYHYSTNTGLNAVSVGDFVTPETTRAQSNNGTEKDRQFTVSGNWTGIFSPRVVNELRGQYSRETRPRLSNSALTGMSTVIGTTGARNFLPTTEFDWRTQFGDSLTWNIGKHSVKIGGDYNRLYADQFFKFNQFGIFNVSASTAELALDIMSVGQCPVGTCSNDPLHRFDNTSQTYLVNVGNGLANMTQDLLALYIQDSWRVTPRFTFNVGFRWEGYWNPSPSTSNTALTTAVATTTFPCCGKVNPGFIPDNVKQLMPRIGFAWDPWGDGKTVIRGNAGFYYAANPLLLFAGPINNFRTPAGDLSVQLPFSTTTLATCPAPPPGSPAGLTLTSYCRTVYGQFLWANGAAGPAIDLDTLTLSTLPTLTPAQLTNIAVGLGLPFDPNQGAQPTTWADDYSSPRSWNWNIGVQREMIRGLTMGVDLAYINTVHLQRNRDWNLPTPVVFLGASRPGPSGTTVNFPADASQRPCFGLFAGTACTPSVTVTLSNASTATVTVPSFARPISTLGQVQVRESNARALYRAFTYRLTYRRKRYQFQTYYTFSKNKSDDDNERDAGGNSAVQNIFQLRSDYSYSNLDARHLVVFNSVVELPYDFTIGALGKFRSGRPFSPTTGTITAFAVPTAANITGLPAGVTVTSITVASTTNDPNGDRYGVDANRPTDRPFLAPGISYGRNSFRDRAIYNFDLRAAKTIRLPREGMRLEITVDFFNLFNFDNVVYGSSRKNFGSGISATNAALVTPPTTFMQLKDPTLCETPLLPPTGTVLRNKSCYDANNIPNFQSQPFQMQVGIRFQF